MIVQYQGLQSALYAALIHSRWITQVLTIFKFTFLPSDESHHKIQDLIESVSI